MTARGSRRAVVFCALGLLGLALVAGCGDSQPEPEPTSSAPSPAASLAADVLLAPDEMPEWNGAITWAAADLDESTPALAVCALPTPESLAALDVETQEYSTSDADPLLGINEVSLYADSASASSALAAFDSAMSDCRSGSKISTADSGHTWVADAADPDQPDSGRFDFIGFAVKGSALAMVGFSLHGQDANFEDDPLADAMAASLARLP